MSRQYDGTDACGPPVRNDGPSHGSELDALYLYCVVPGADDCEWPGAGIDGACVFAVSSGEVSALAHACRPQAYTGSDDVVRSRVATHAAVVEKAWEHWGTVIPMGFDVIIKACEARTARDNTVLWLRHNQSYLMAKLEEFRGRAEFGVQIFLDRRRVLDMLRRTNKRILALAEEMAGKPEGIRYFYRERIERVLRDEMEAIAPAACRDYSERISRLVAAVCVNKLKGDGSEKQMILNLSVLVPVSDAEQLGDELERIASDQTVEVRFTGPWPPYSFVGSEIKRGALDNKGVGAMV